LQSFERRRLQIAKQELQIEKWSVAPGLNRAAESVSGLSTPLPKNSRNFLWKGLQSTF
jgi:hypothetical protein